MSQETVQLLPSRFVDGRTLMGAQFRSSVYEIEIVNYTILTLRQRINVPPAAHYWRPLWHYLKPNIPCSIGAVLVEVIARDRDLRIGRPENERLIKSCLARARDDRPSLPPIRKRGRRPSLRTVAKIPGMSVADRARRRLAALDAQRATDRAAVRAALVCVVCTQPLLCERSSKRYCSVCCREAMRQQRRRELRRANREANAGIGQEAPEPREQGADKIASLG
jgi:hypothetical protein